MSLLLDTHALLWSATDPGRLPAIVRDEMETAELIFVSPVSAYELTFKHALDKLPSAGPVLRDLPRFLASRRFQVLPITLVHAEKAGRLPLNHRDPFDRLLAAQALVEGLTLVSVDAKLDRFGVRRLW